MIVLLVTATVFFLIVLVLNNKIVAGYRNYCSGQAVGIAKIAAGNAAEKTHHAARARHCPSCPAVVIQNYVHNSVPIGKNIWPCEVRRPRPRQN